MIQKDIAEFGGQKVVLTQDAVVQLGGITFDKPLKPGPHTFKLIVVDDTGVESDAAVQTITVLPDIRKSTAAITAPANVAFGQPFTLDGTKSTPVPGRKITSFKWTMVN